MSYVSQTDRMWRSERSPCASLLQVYMLVKYVYGSGDADLMSANNLLSLWHLANLYEVQQAIDDIATKCMHDTPLDIYCELLMSVWQLECV